MLSTVPAPCPCLAHLGGRMELRMSSVCVTPGRCSTGGSVPCRSDSRGHSTLSPVRLSRPSLRSRVACLAQRLAAALLVLLLAAADEHRVLVFEQAVVLRHLAQRLFGSGVQGAGCGQSRMCRAARSVRVEAAADGGDRGNTQQKSSTELNCERGPARARRSTLRSLEAKFGSPFLAFLHSSSCFSRPR